MVRQPKIPGSAAATRIARTPVLPSNLCASLFRRDLIRTEDLTLTAGWTSLAERHEPGETVQLGEESLPGSGVCRPAQHDQLKCLVGVESQLRDLRRQPGDRQRIGDAPFEKPQDFLAQKPDGRVLHRGEEVWEPGVLAEAGEPPGVEFPKVLVPRHGRFPSRESEADSVGEGLDEAAVDLAPLPEGGAGAREAAPAQEVG